MISDVKTKIDDLDYKLIQELKTDSRRSVRQLAKSLNESPSTIYNRVKRLEAKEIIKKWTVSLDYSLLNLDTISFIFVSLNKLGDMKTNGKSLHQMIAEELVKIKGVYEVHFISGDFDILIKLRAESVKAIGNIVMNEIRAIPGVAKTVTSTCFDTILEEWDVIEF